MSICPYCMHEAGIDEELGTCKFCGAPRVEIEKKIEIPKKRVLYESNIIEEDIRTPIAIPSEKYVRLLKNDKQLPTLRVIAALGIILMFISLIFIGWTPPPPEGTPVYVKFNCVNIFNDNTLTGYEINIYSSQTHKLIEQGVLSNGIYQTFNKYLNGQKIIVNIDGNNIYCDFSDEIQISLTAQEMQEGIDLVTIKLIEKASSFIFHFTAMDGSLVDGLIWDHLDNFNFNLVVQNMKDLTGYVNSYNMSTESDQRAYVYIRFSDIVFPIEGFNYMVGDPVSITIIYNVENNFLNRNTIDGKNGNISAFGSIIFMNSGNITLHYGLILDGDINIFSSAGTWGNNVIKYEETAMMVVV
jgi:hypothetical protein